MIYYNKIDLSEGIDRSNNNRECVYCHYCYFNDEFKFHFKSRLVIVAKIS